MKNLSYTDFYAKTIQEFTKFALEKVNGEKWKKLEKNTHTVIPFSLEKSIDNLMFDFSSYNNFIHQKTVNDKLRMYIKLCKDDSFKLLMQENVLPKVDVENSNTLVNDVETELFMCILSSIFVAKNYKTVRSFIKDLKNYQNKTEK